MNDFLLQIGIELVERGYIPDFLTRQVIQCLCADRVQQPSRTRSKNDELAHQEFLMSLSEGPVALSTEKANEQHYEIPVDFFCLMLGPHRKYSCCYFRDEHSTLADAEEAALSMTCEHAELMDGQEILELGCGWGSLSLWMAERFPRSQITAVSNSASQRRHIENIASSKQLTNLKVVTADMNDFEAEIDSFDRVVSIEMFEHMRNYRELLDRIGNWMKPDGKLFIHIFCHRELIYPFETEGTANWMGRHFFTGGIMPNANLLTSFNETLHVTKHWEWEGTHYRRTADEWLRNLDSRKIEAIEILNSVYGKHEGRRWFYRWRLFLIAVSELFGYSNGREWFVIHNLLEPVSSVRHEKASLR